MPFNISLTNKITKIEMKKNKQTIKMRVKIGSINCNFVKNFATSNKYRLIKNINANNKGRIIS